MSNSTERATEAAVKTDWECFLTDLKREVRGSLKKVKEGKSVAPYDTPDGVLKRMTYRFVRDKLNNGQGNLLGDVLDNIRAKNSKNIAQSKRIKLAKISKHAKNIKVIDDTDRREIIFSANPFQCALRQIPANTRNFRRDELTRFGRQMIYAYWHGIEPDLLIGFLMQTGTIKEVAHKVTDDPVMLEKWFQDKRKEEESAAAKKSRYPLAIIHFTATSTASDSCPIEVGFAKARGPKAPISFKSILIEPSPDWNINEKWPSAREIETGIKLDDLINGFRSRSARDVIGELAELSEGVAVVHCEDVGNVSHWLDMLIGAAGWPTDFQLRDVGDFLNHSANKRAELRRTRKKIPMCVGSAGEEAKQLCEAVRSIARH